MPKPITPDVSMFMDELGQLPNAKHHLQFLSDYDMLENLAEQGKAEVVLKIKHIEAARRTQMQWLADTLDIQTHNDAEELKHGESLGLDENEVEQFYEAQYQDYTPMPALETWEEWVNKDTAAYLKNVKIQGVAFKGVQVSYSEANQNGLGMMELFQAKKKKKGTTIYPLKFRADTPNGKQFIVFEDEGEYDDFVELFGDARINLFNKKEEISEV